jgi:hypothetical protein
MAAVGTREARLTLSIGPGMETVRIVLYSFYGQSELCAEVRAGR